MTQAPPKPMTEEWMLDTPPPEGGVIHEAQCGCLFIYDDAARWWERCDDHPDDYGPDGCLGMKEDE